MRTLRIEFLIGFVACLLVTLSRGQWEARCVADGRSAVVMLPISPIWKPPAPPSYVEFRDPFRDPFEPLPQWPPTQAQITTVLKPDWMLVDFLLYFWWLCVGVGLIYVAVRNGQTDAVLHWALWMGVGMSVAAATCFGLYLVFGGWGPPAPLAFAVIGVVFGAALAWTTPVQSRNQAMDPSGNGDCGS